MPASKTIKNLFYYLVRKRHNLRLMTKGVRVNITQHISLHKTASLKFGSGCRLMGGDIRIGPHSSLVVGSGTSLRGKIIIGEECSVELGENFKLVDADILIHKSSKMTTGKDSMVASTSPYKTWVYLHDGGTMTLGINTRISGSNIVVENSCFTLGSNSFINYGSEVTCIYGITIGEYVFISYFVDIFDNNSHSTDWQQRRAEVIRGYPNATVRGEKKPNGKPIYLGNDVWIGKGATILKGCRIGSRSIIGMHSVVTISCDEDSVLAGNPATVRKQLSYDYTV